MRWLIFVGVLALAGCASSGATWTCKDTVGVVLAGTGAAVSAVGVPVAGEAMSGAGTAAGSGPCW